MNNFPGFALDCYLCIGSAKSDCAKEKLPSYAKQTCQKMGTRIIDSCLTVRYLGKKNILLDVNCF